MNDDGLGSALIGGFVVGIIVGTFGMAMFLTQCDRVNPTALDAHKIDMVKRGYAEWVTDTRGKTEWKLLDSLDTP